MTLTKKERFRNLAAEVLSQCDMPLSHIPIKERVIDLLISKGKSTHTMGNVSPRAVSSLLKGDPQRRFIKVDTQPDMWRLKS